MEMDAVDTLVSDVIEQVASNKKDLKSAVEFVVDFSGKHSVSPETLLKLSAVFDTEKMYKEKYMFSRACAELAGGKLREDSLLRAGNTALALGAKVKPGQC